MTARHFLALGGATLVLVLTGCSGTGPAHNAATRDDVVEQPAIVEKAAPSPNATTGMTTGGDGSPINISPLSAADLESAKLAGELGCSFSGGDATLLVAKGDVASAERAFGVVRIGDYVEPVSAPGGYDMMAKGTTFAGKGMTIAIAITGAPIEGGESPPRPATLTLDRADGARRVLIGDWVCGP